jgi:hypothetical protein
VRARAAAAADQRRHHARHSNLFTHLVTQRAQVLRDERCSPGFLVAKLWVLVNVSSPPDHSRFDRGRGHIQPLVDWTRRRSHNVSCKRARWGGPDQRAAPQAHAAAMKSRRLRPLDGAASAKNALRVCRLDRQAHRVAPAAIEPLPHPLVHGGSEDPIAAPSLGERLRARIDARLPSGGEGRA